MRPSRLLPPLSLLLLAAALRADVRCALPFSDHMVLQRDRPVNVWGEAAPGEAVTVEFAGQRKAAVATAAGRWSVALDPMPASAEPRTLTVRGRNTITFGDVLVGEVWLCSGQSNMEKPLGPRKGQKPTDHYRAEVERAEVPTLRLFEVPWYAKPKAGVTGLRWVPCTPETVMSTEFSAAAYYFGRELVRELGVPVGLIHSSFGGTQIEAWMPAAAFASDPALRDLINVHYFAWVPGVQPTDLYQSMIVPLEPYTLRGFLWYQGESNVMQADGAIYTAKQRALIASWRAAWGEPDAPFYYVQIAPFDYSRWDKFPKLLTPEALPLFWAAQTAGLAVPHTGMVVTTDLVRDFHDIHPTDKRDVGLRLARLALAKTYGRRDLLAESPQWVAMRPARDGRVELRFDHTGTGLASRDGRPLNDFTVAGADRRFVPATAVIAGGDRVMVSSPQVARPVAVRFAWDETADPNLVNSAGLPAVSFRTDSWPVVAVRPKPAPAATPRTP
jgi:sialate O-acetylesterase